MSFIKNAWNGRERLWKAFWLGLVLPHTAYGVFDEAIKEIQNPYKIIIVALFFAYATWACVSVWRCAPNVGWAGFRYLARGIVAVEAAVLCILLLIVAYLALMFR